MTFTPDARDAAVEAVAKVLNNRDPFALVPWDKMSKATKALFYENAREVIAAYEAALASPPETDHG